MTFGSGSNVSIWNDKSGNGNNAVQATAGNQPTYTMDGGYPAILFNSASSNYLNGGPLLKSTSFSWFTVYRTTTPSTSQYIFLDYKSGNGNPTNQVFVQGTVLTDGTANGYIFYGTLPSATYKTGVSSVGSNRAIMEILDSAGNNNSNFFQTGSAVSTTFTNAGATPISTDSDGYILGGGKNPSVFSTTFLNGYIYEVVVFLNELSASQRNQVEGYLASKWGLHGQLPASHPYSSKVPFLPTQIPGCQLWLDAADTTTITGTSSVTAWADKSGVGNNATPVSGGTPTLSNINGVPAIVPSLGFTGAITNTTATLTCFAAAVFSAADYAGLVSVGGTGYDDNSSISGCAVFTKHGNVNDIYTTRNNTSTPYITFPLNSAFVASTVFDNTSNTTYLNGGTSQVAVASSYGNFGYTKYGIGTRILSYAFSSNWTGPIGEIIIYNAALSTSQRNQVEQYLGQKWAISAFNQPSPGGYLIPYNRPFYPTDIPGCSLWLDAGDRSSMTFSSGSNVSAWADKSGLGNNVTVASGTPVYESNGITLAAAALQTSTYTTISAGETVIYVVCMCIYMSTANFDYVFTCTDGAVNGDCSIRFSNNTQLNSGFAGGTTFYINGTTTTANSVSVPLGFNVIGATPTTVSGLTRFGIGDTSTQSRYFYGYVKEVLVYSSLTTSQRQQVEQYLAWKWGLVANLPTGHPGKLLPAFSTKFTVKSISGLALWLDAADSSTITGTSSVTAWRDKSGAGNNMSLTSAGISYASNTITVAGGACMTSAVTTAITANQSFVFIVCQPTDVVGSFAYSFMCPNINADYTVRFGSTTTLYNYDNSSDFGYSNGYYVNGTLYAGGTNVVITIPAQTNIIGGASTLSGSSVFQLSRVSGGRYFNGTIQEVIFYAGPISTPQRQQVEGYLAWKWGLQSSLPSTHAYAKFAP
jgi:hypothetical protein